MKDTNNAPKTVAGALEELGAELGISEADFGGKVEIEDKGPVIASGTTTGSRECPKMIQP